MAGDVHTVIHNDVLLLVQMLGNLCHTVIYGFLCALLSVFEESTLGDTEVCVLVSLSFCL